jgi:methionyl-tRNA formyltransferase
MGLRVVFMGTPAFAVPTLTMLRREGHDIAAVYTRQPQLAGRGMGERMSPVHQAARDLDLPLVMPKTLRIPAAESLFAGHRADCAVVVAYGLILPGPILEAPRLGCLNLHASLLPRWRGAAPIQRAIMAGDVETGVMVMRMEEGLDTGPICLAERTAIGAAETAGDLSDRLAGLGAGLLARALVALERGDLVCRAQPDEGATYAAKIDKAEARLDWRQPADQIRRRINALSPAPGAWCEIVQGAKAERIRMLRASPAEGGGVPGAVLAVEPLIVAAAAGAVRIDELQRAGRKPGSAAEFVRGARLKPGDRFA